MKIAIWHNLPSGGGMRQMYDHVIGLLARGHTVEIWCPPTANRSYLPLGARVIEHVLPLDYVDIAALPKWQRALRLPGFIQRNIAAMDAHCRACAAEINAAGFDVLYAQACQFFRSTSIAQHVRLPSAIYLGEPYRWLYEAMRTADNVIAEPLWIAPNGNLKVRLRDAIMTPMFRAQMRYEIDSARAFSCILVNSYFSRESVLRTYGLDAEVCRLGVDVSQFHDLGLPRERVVLGVGAFVPEKNIELAIRAVGAIEAATRPNLVWVGNVANAAYVSQLRQLAAGLGVNFAPQIHIPQTELLQWLNRAAVMLYAPRLEPFGYAPLEANACALPVVAVAEGGLRETIIDGVNGLLAEPSAPALAAALLRLLDDTPFARTLGAQASAHVQSHWALPPATTRLETLLQQAMGNVKLPIASH